MASVDNFVYFSWHFCVVKMVNYQLTILQCSMSTHSQYLKAQTL